MEKEELFEITEYIPKKVGRRGIDKKLILKIFNTCKKLKSNQSFIVERELMSYDTIRRHISSNKELKDKFSIVPVGSSLFDKNYTGSRICLRNE